MKERVTKHASVRDSGPVHCLKGCTNGSWVAMISRLSEKPNLRLQSRLELWSRW